MCLSKYSNLELLREVAMNLQLSEDHRNMNELSVGELAGLINSFYQGQEGKVTTGGEKRKNEVDTGYDSKKLRVLHKLSDILSALELLPNEVYEMILKGLDGEDKKNLRLASKRLYEKTSLTAPIFKDWCFQASRRISPDLISDTSKNLRVHALKTKPPTDHTGHLIKEFAHRISSIRLDFKGVLLNNLERKPAEFLHLTSLDLESVAFSKNSLLALAPQLENLRLANLKKQEFDISSLDIESKAFTKLKNLKLISVYIDLKTILTKCCSTLQSLELAPLILSDNLEHELTSLNYLSIQLNTNDSELFMSNLLSKCSESLRILKLESFFANGIDFSTLLKQTMKITTLEIANLKCNIEMFLNMCPLIQNLSLKSFQTELEDVVLKDLLNLDFENCDAKCVNSFLKNLSSLKTLRLSNSSYELREIEFSVIPKVDTVWISSTAEIGQVLKLFPRNVKVTAETLGDKTVLRRVYDLP